MLTLSTSMTVKEDRAFQSKGASSNPVYRMAARAIKRLHQGGTLIDVGCGQGNLWPWVADSFDEYVGVDAVTYEGFPASETFIKSDLDQEIPWPDSSADVAVCLETIEHLENPRALFRELRRLAKPGGWVMVSTPNQLSWLSKVSLAWKNQFVHFQEKPGLYPAHLTALLEIDLVRIARETNLMDPQVIYSGVGRIPATGLHWPRPLAATGGWRGRAFSDNVMLVARRAF